MSRGFRIEYRATRNGTWEPVSQKGWETASRAEWKAECERFRQIERRSQNPQFEYRLVTRLCIDWMLA